MDVTSEVGFCAGEIYGLLAGEGGEIPMSQILKRLRREDDLIIAAVGWLLREDKIEIIKKERGITVKLK